MYTTIAAASAMSTQTNAFGQSHAPAAAKREGAECARQRTTSRRTKCRTVVEFSAAGNHLDGLNKANVGNVIALGRCPGRKPADLFGVMMTLSERSRGLAAFPDADGADVPAFQRSRSLRGRCIDGVASADEHIGWTVSVVYVSNGQAPGLPLSIVVATCAGSFPTGTADRVRSPDTTAPRCR